MYTFILNEVETPWRDSLKPMPGETIKRECYRPAKCSDVNWSPTASKFNKITKSWYMYSDLDSDCTFFSFTGSWMKASFIRLSVCSSKQHRCKPGSEKRCQRNKNHGWKSGNMLCLLPMKWAQRKSSIETVLGWIKSKIIIKKKLRSRRFCNFLKTHKFHAVSKITFRQLLNKLARLMLLKFSVKNVRSDII